MAVGLSAPRSNSARVDPHDHHHSQSHHHKPSQSHRSHSHWWQWGHKKTQPQDDAVVSSHSHSRHGVAPKARYQRHHTTDSIPSIPEHRPTTFNKRGSVTLQQHDDPRTVTRRKRIVLHAIFKC